MPNQGLVVTSPSVRPVCSTWSCCYWVLVSLPWINHIIIVISLLPWSLQLPSRRACRRGRGSYQLSILQTMMRLSPVWDLFIPKDAHFSRPWNCKPAFKVFPWKGCKSFWGCVFVVFGSCLVFSWARFSCYLLHFWSKKISHLHVVCSIKIDNLYNVLDLGCIVSRKIAGLV